MHQILIGILLCSWLAIGSTYGGFTPIVTLPYGPTTLIRTPQHDSAIVRSEQQGGNFIYSVSEGHAYETVQPYIRTLTQPIGYSYQWHSIPIASASIPSRSVYFQHSLDTIPSISPLVVSSSAVPPTIIQSESTQSSVDENKFTDEDSSLKSEDISSFGDTVDDSISIESA